MFIIKSIQGMEAPLVNHSYAPSGRSGGVGGAGGWWEGRPHAQATLCGGMLPRVVHLPAQAALTILEEL